MEEKNDRYHTMFKNLLRDNGQTEDMIDAKFKQNSIYITDRKEETRILSAHSGWKLQEKRDRNKRGFHHTKCLYRLKKQVVI